MGPCNLSPPARVGPGEDPSDDLAPHALEDRIIAHVPRLRAFLRKLSGSAQDTEDLVQDTLEAGLAAALFAQVQVASVAFMSGLDVTVISAPRYLASPFQHVNMSMGQKVTYVSDYEIRKIDSPKGYVADPVVEEAFDGILLEGTGAFVDENFIGLDSRLVIAEIHKPIHTETLAERRKDMPAAIRRLNLKVALPSTTKTTLKTKALVPNHGWAIFSLGRPHKQHRILILKVEQIKPGK